MKEFKNNPRVRNGNDVKTEHAGGDWETAKEAKTNLIGRKQKWRKECHYHLIFRLLGDIFTLGIRISAFFNLILSHLHIYEFHLAFSRFTLPHSDNDIENWHKKQTEIHFESKPRHKIDKSTFLYVFYFLYFLYMRKPRGENESQLKK